MRLHRFIGDFDLSRPRVRVSGGHAQQIREVLRLRTGDVLLLADGKGAEAACRIIEMSREGLECEIEERVGNDREPALEVALYLAVLRRENFEWAVEKATEAGARRIVPLISRRTVKLGLNAERLKKIAREAAEQSGRAKVPEISEAVELGAALAQASGPNFLFEPGYPPFRSFEARIKKAEGIGVWIGPEGGWAPEEVRAAEEAKFLLAGLGKLVLRAETAAAVAVFEAVSLYEA